MMYLSIIILVFLLSYCYDICGYKQNKEEWYCLVLVVLICIAGLRWRIGADTVMYIRQFYHEIPYIWQINYSDLTIGEYPLWMIFNSLVKSIGGRFYMVQFMHAAFVNILLFRYFKKHSKYIFTCVFFYLIWRYKDYNFEEMKATISLILFLYGTDYMIEKKWIKGGVLYLIGCFFHYTAFLLFVTPLLLFIRLNKKGVAILALVLMFSFIVNYYLGDFSYLLEFDDRIYQKAEHWLSGEDKEKSFYYYIYQIWIFIFYALGALLFVKKFCPQSKILKFEPLVIIGVMTLILQIHVHFFYRYSHFYSVYIIFFISSLYVKSWRGFSAFNKSFSFLRAFLIILPLLLCLGKHYSSDIRHQYYPYSSIFDKTVDRQRENRINKYMNRGYPNHNEY